MTMNTLLSKLVLSVPAVLFLFFMNLPNSSADEQSGPDLLGAHYLNQCVYSDDSRLDDQSIQFLTCCTEELKYCVSCPKDSNNKCDIYRGNDLDQYLLTKKQPVPETTPVEDVAQTGIDKS
jgi:hypothetical protein